jgi:DNA ligase 1
MARARRNEGLLVKDPTSGYSPGRRGLGWLKMKKALATIDCVVVGVEVGHGKRHGVLSDYTFAVRDEASGQLVTIGKAYSGLTDAEIAEMTRWFEAHTISVHGRYRVVEPQVVVEVAFDVIMRSARHKSGFALRFPRIANLRPDKPVGEIDTLATVTRLYEGLQLGAEHLVTARARQ